MYYIVFNSCLVSNYNKDMFIEFEEKNKKKDITGMLVCYGDDIIQIIEGEKDNVIKLFEKIKNDKRHTIINLIKQGSVTSRMFPGQAMRHELIPKMLPRQNISSLFNVIAELKKVSILFETFITNLTRYS